MTDYYDWRLRQLKSDVILEKFNQDLKEKTSELVSKALLVPKFWGKPSKCPPVLPEL
jgi:hypothetical protein